MAAKPRPSNQTETINHLQQGEPFVSFAPLLSNGAFGPFRDLGIVQDAEIAKELELSTLRNAQSGIQVIARELVNFFRATINVGLSQINPENMQLFLASGDLRNVTAAGTQSLANDPFQLTDDPEDYLLLSNALIDESSVTSGDVTCSTITSESVGTGQGGVFGETTGDFALDFKPNVIGDVTSFLIDTTERQANLVAGNTPLAGEIAIEVGATAASGSITFPSGEAPANGAVLAATYTPSFTFAPGVVDGLDFILDPKFGRIRMFQFGGATDALKAFQNMEVDYDYTAIIRDEIDPFTQFDFNGKARVELLTDVGINIIWEIPNVTVRLTDDAFTFSRDDFLTANLQIILNDNGGSAPFGTAQLFEEQ